MPSKSSLRSRWPDLKNIFILAILIGIAFLPCLSAQFIYWDDDLHVLNNPLVYRTDFGGIVSIFQTVVNKTYIPLTILSFNIEHRLFGLNPFVYHLDNLLLHILVCALAYALARRMGLEAMTAFLAALLFGIHPMHVESVAWITERKDVLYSAFYLWGLLEYCRYVRSNNKNALALCICAGFLSLLAKPMALSFPLVLWIFDWFFKRRLNAGLFLEKIPFLLFIPIVWQTYALNITAHDHSFGESILIWLWSFSFYLEKFFLPVGLTPLYTLPYPIAITNPQYLLAIAVGFATLGTVLRFRSNRWFLFAALYYFVSIFFLLRMSDVAKNLGPSVVADRFMYLPSLGICLWMAHTLNEYIKAHPGNRRFVVRLLVIAILLLSVATSSQCRVWKDDLSLWDHVIGRGEPIALAHNSRGAALSKRGEQTLALQDINKALELNPQYALAYYNRGKIYAGLGENSRAIEDFTTAIKMNPKHEKSFLERGIVQSKQGQLTQALEDFNAALMLDPNDAGAYNNRGIVYKKMGQWEQALKEYDRAIAINPRSAHTYINRGIVWRELKHYDKAFQDMQRAQELGSPSAETYLHEADILSGKTR